MKIDIDDHGIFANPSFHDGRIFGIMVRSESEVELYLSDIYEKQFILTLRGVHSLNAHDFYMGSIINVIQCLDWVDASSIMKQEALKYGASLKLDSSYKLIHIAPSYGCELGAVFTEMKLKQVNGSCVLADRNSSN